MAKREPLGRPLQPVASELRRFHDAPSVRVTMYHPSFPRFLILLALMLVTGPSQGQVWETVGRAAGRVEEAGGSPLVGAEVVLSPESADLAPTRTAVTEERGEWALAGLAPGTWRILVRAEGYVAAEGTIAVSGGPSTMLRTVLRSLAEVPPSRTEGNPQTIRKWLTRGNSLLEEGRSAAARAEYEKAVRALPPEETPAVLRAIARTHYLEGDPGAAWDRLRHALVLAPEDAETRGLFAALSSSQGREDEAALWLARVQGEAPEVLLAELGQAGEEMPPQAAWTPPESELRPAVEHEKGRFRTSFRRSSPWSNRKTIAARDGLHPEELGEGALDYVLADETFEVYVPPSYHEGEPAALFVWVSPLPWGGFTRESLREVLDRRGVLWIGANASGNERSKWDRMGLALDAAENMMERYDIDRERVWVGGYSGGGRTASAIAVLFPEVFRGGFFFMGVDCFENVPALDRPGAHWPASFPLPSGRELARARDRNRYVFFTGELDFNRIQTREFHARYQDAGFRHLLLVDVPGISHYSGLEGAYLEEGLAFLDGAAEEEARPGSD